MAERSAQQARDARDELRRVVGFSVSDELSKLDALRKWCGTLRNGVRHPPSEAPSAIDRSELTRSAVSVRGVR